MPPEAAFVRLAASALAVAVAAGGPAPAAAGPAAERCVPGSAALRTGPGALLVRRAAGGDRAELSACRRGTGPPLRLGATYGNAVRPSSGPRSTLTAAAVGGAVVAASFEVAAGGCIYEGGCGAVARRVLRIADTGPRTLRRIPLRGTPTALAVSARGVTTFRVDEFACTSTYRTAAAPGSPIAVVRRVATRVPGPGGQPRCPVA